MWEIVCQMERIMIIQLIVGLIKKTLNEIPYIKMSQYFLS